LILNKRKAIVTFSCCWF